MKLPDIGDQFQRRYRIDEVLGEGGFGTVYAAFDLEASRQVALKVLKPDRGEAYADTTRARFGRELNIVANLQSAHTVVLFDGGETAEGLLYMVFERVPGEDLSTLIDREGRLDPKAALHIVWQLLDSLAEAHNHGLLHRDLKPHNVRVFDYAGDPRRVKLLDFGLARHAEGELSSVTSTGEIVGTPRYMAPEQMMERQLSPASDIYSLGMVAIEMLFGREVLYGQRWQEQLGRLRSGHVFSMPEVERVGAGLIAVIQRMTARNPEDRYQTAAAVRTALEQLSQPQHEEPSRVETAPPAEAKTPALGAIAAVLATLCGLAALVVWQQWPEDPPPVDPRPQVDRASVGALIAQPDVVAPAAEDVGVVADVQSSDVPDLPAWTGRSAGCGAKPRNVGLGYLKWSGGSETYGFVPRNYDPDRAYPVVVALHQTASNAYRMMRLSKFAELAERDDVIVIAPQGATVMTWVDGLEDVAMVRRVVRNVTADLCVDLSRIYVAGHGKGGDLARRMVCEPWVAAVATNSFRGGRGHRFCEPETGVRYLMLSPLHSDREPVQGGRPCGVGAMLTDFVAMSLREAEADWEERNGCRGKPRVSHREEGTTCYTWACKTPLESCHVDGGHDWAGAGYRSYELEAACDGKPPEFEAGKHMWKFLLESPPNERPGWKDPL